MTRAWLILADILVVLLLLLSLILFYLSPSQTPLKRTPVTVTLPFYDWEQNISFESVEKVTFGEDAIITEKEWVAMAESQNTVDEIIADYLISVSLQERMEKLSVKKGDWVFIRIFKEESLLEVWIRSGGIYEHLKNYFICAYSGGLGPKLKEGDRQSPEGFYKVKKHQLNPNSKFHLSFNLGYPNAYDRAHKRTGSFLMVHGNCVSIGCYAMTDAKIEEIYGLVEAALGKGQKFVPVHIYPFKMTEENMIQHSESKWFDFWMDLKKGYDYFEAEKLPAKISVKNKRYVIAEADE